MLSEIIYSHLKYDLVTMHACAKHGHKYMYRTLRSSHSFLLLSNDGHLLPSMISLYNSLLALNSILDADISAIA